MIKTITKLVSGALLLTVLGLLSGIIAARYLDPDARGLLASILLIPTLISGFITLGTNYSATFEISKNKDTASTSFWIVILTSLLCSIFAIVVYLIYFKIKDLDVNNENIWLHLSFLVIYLFAVSILGASHAVFLGISDFKNFNAVKIMPAVMYLFSVCSLILKANVDTVIFIYSILMILIVIPYTLHTVIPNLQGVRNLNRIVFQGYLRHGLLAFLPNIPLQLSSKLDQLAILYVLNNNKLGIYVVACSFGQVVYGLNSVIGNIYLSNQAVAFDNSSIIKLLKNLMVVNILILFIYSYFSEVIIHLLFGNQYVSGATISIVLLAASMLNGMTYILYDSFRGRGFLRYPIIGELMQLGIKLFLIFLVIQLTIVVEFYISLAVLLSSFVVFIYSLFILKSNKF